MRESTHNAALFPFPLLTSTGAPGSPAAEQQPEWSDHPDRTRTIQELAATPTLIDPGEIASLRESMAAVALGSARVLQAGDCAESFDECTPEHVADRLRMLNALADRLSEQTHQPVVRVGRIAGQFAKPRSSPVELHDGRELSAFRGHMINSAEPSPEARCHDPRRMLLAREASARVLSELGSARRGDIANRWLGPWTSHEALVLDYETCHLRLLGLGGPVVLTSTHLPWIGERSRQADGPHVRMLAQVANTVAVKLGPGARLHDVLALCQILDPERDPGRLGLIVRTGHDRIAEWLPPVARAVRAAGHPAVWLCDPMHGNTLRAPSGRKTRLLDHVLTEARTFRLVLEKLRLHPGGLHLEVAAGAVTECLDEGAAEDTEPGHVYTTLCDPRLNPAQAARVIDEWAS